METTSPPVGCWRHVGRGVAAVSLLLVTCGLVLGWFNTPLHETGMACIGGGTPDAGTDATPRAAVAAYFRSVEPRYRLGTEARVTKDGRRRVYHFATGLTTEVQLDVMPTGRSAWSVFGRSDCFAVRD